MIERMVPVVLWLVFIGIIAKLTIFSGGKQ